MEQNQIVSGAAKLEMKAIKKAIVKAAKTSLEQNSRGDKVTWLRLADDVKDNAEYIVTSKNNVEYAAKLARVNAESVRDMAFWLSGNSDLDNVQEWVNGLFVAVNRPILALAGASGFAEAELIEDIESLVAFETLQSARGRKASKFDSDNWKAYSPVLSACLKAFFEGKKIENTAPLVNKYLHLIKGAIVHFNPIGDQSTMDKAASMIEFTFEWIVANKPDMEALGAFAVTVMEANKQKFSVDGESEY